MRRVKPLVLVGDTRAPTLELYTAVIDEARTKNIRVIAHIYTLEDAKATLKAGLDAFAHGVRDKDLDEECLSMVKQRPHLELGPNMPDRGVVADTPTAIRRTRRTSRWRTWSPPACRRRR